jgi:hypothetical protein
VSWRNDARVPIPESTLKILHRRPPKASVKQGQNGSPVACHPARQRIQQPLASSGRISRRPAAIFCHATGNSRTMIQANFVKSDSIAKVLDRALDKGKGLLRLTPTWVPRSFFHTGRRIKL